MKYNIISTGSKGNAVIVADSILIDCGVPYKSLKPFVNNLKLVLLTHIHGDHFKHSTIERLAEERPMLRFGCCKWLASQLVECGVAKRNIDVYTYDTGVYYGQNFPVAIEVFPLFHDVPNCGYKILFENERVLYATDTNKILTEAKGYDLYLIEANYTEDGLQERIDRKLSEGADYIYDMKVPENHLSREAASAWLLSNSGSNSKVEFLHVHHEQSCCNT